MGELTELGKGVVTEVGVDWTSTLVLSSVLTETLSESSAFFFFFLTFPRPDPTIAVVACVGIVRPRAEIHALGFHVTKCGCDRHHEVERRRSFLTNAVFSNNESIVDFVLESGNGESDSLVESTVAGAVVGDEDQPLSDTNSGRVSNENSNFTARSLGLAQESNALRQSSRRTYFVLE